MTRIAWSRLATLDDWAGALEKLLEQARKAAESGRSTRRMRARERLLEFIDRSPAKARALDAIARRASRDLFEEGAAAATAAIVSRADELMTARGLIEAVTAEAGRDARAVRLEHALEVADRLEVALRTLAELETTLADPDNDLLDEVEAILEALGRLRELAEGRRAGRRASSASPRRRASPAGPR